MLTPKIIGKKNYTRKKIILIISTLISVASVGMKASAEPGFNIEVTSKNVSTLVGSLDERLPQLLARSRNDQWTKRALEESMVSTLSSLEKSYDYKSYAELNRHKAAAVCLHENSASFISSMSSEVAIVQLFEGSLAELTNWQMRAWGQAYERDTPEDANAAALESCNEGKAKYAPNSICQCEIITTNEEFVYRFPKHVTDKYERAVVEFEKLIKSIISQTEKNIAYKEVASAKNDGKSDIRLSAPRPLKIGYPDAKYDYRQYCQDRIYYTLLPIESDVAEAVRNQLRSAREKGLYGCYKVRVSMPSDNTESYRDPPTGDLLKLTENQCRFVDQISDSAEIEKAAVPNNLATTITADNTRELWVEGAVRVADSGVPLIVRDYIRPLLVRGERQAYVGVEMIAPGTLHCAASWPFKNKVFEIGGCDFGDQCVQRLLGRLLEMMEISFAAPPFEATRVQDFLPPGELWMERLYKPSLLLGGPIFEQSTYTIETWSSNTERVLVYGRELYKGASSPEKLDASKRSSIFLTVHHILMQTTNRLDVYTNPNPKQLAIYSEAIKTETAQVVETLCEDFQGELRAGVCHVPGRNAR